VRPQAGIERSPIATTMPARSRFGEGKARRRNVYLTQQAGIERPPSATTRRRDAYVTPQAGIERSPTAMIMPTRSRFGKGKAQRRDEQAMR